MLTFNLIIILIIYFSDISRIFLIILKKMLKEIFEGRDDLTPPPPPKATTPIPIPIPYTEPETIYIERPGYPRRPLRPKYPDYPYSGPNLGYPLHLNDYYNKPPRIYAH